MKDFSVDRVPLFIAVVGVVMVLLLTVFAVLLPKDFDEEGDTRFEVIQDGIRGIEVIRDMETGCEYLVVRVGGGVGVTRLRTPDCE